MPKVVAICGKLCSGKSCYAKEIKNEYNAVILSVDEATYDLIENTQGEFYDAFAERVKKYLMKKSVETVNAGCNVILDWGFWTAAERKLTNDFFDMRGVKVEWHYIDVDDLTWKELIKLRNSQVNAGNCESDFYVDNALLNKTISLFEIPSRAEIDVWVNKKNALTYRKG